MSVSGDVTACHLMKANLKHGKLFLFECCRIEAEALKLLAKTKKGRTTDLKQESRASKTK